MDDYLSSSTTVEQAKTIIKDVIEINLCANFVMHSWASNFSDTLAGFISTSQNANNKMQLCDRGEERVSGMYWDTAKDMHSFNGDLHQIESDLIEGTRKPTKWKFLKAMISVYDPLGLLCPFLLKSKLILQDVWRTKVGWDEELRDEQQVEWLAWLKSLRKLSEFCIPRCLSPKNAFFESVQLHAFCDASLKAYAANVYIRFKIKNKPAHVASIMARTSVASLKNVMTIPRLELQAALLASHLLKSVEIELDIKCEKRFLWSDSQTVIRWINSEPRTRQMFVARRLGEISELTSLEEWKWVPTKLNPADCATRGVCEAESVKEMWFKGPEFLRETEQKWPQSKILSESQKRSIDEMELKKKHIFKVTFDFNELSLEARIFGWHGLIIEAQRFKNILHH